MTMELKGNYGDKDLESKFRYIRVWKRPATGIIVVGESGMIANF